MGATAAALSLCGELQDDQKHDGVGGPGNGLVAKFGLNGALIANLVSGGPLNLPSGMAIAPSDFGLFAGALLRTLNDTSGKPIAIPGLWSLNFGGGAQSEDP